MPRLDALPVELLPRTRARGSTASAPGAPPSVRGSVRISQAYARNCARTAEQSSRRKLRRAQSVLARRPVMRWGVPGQGSSDAVSRRRSACPLGPDVSMAGANSRVLSHRGSWAHRHEMKMQRPSVRAESIARRGRQMCFLLAAHGDSALEHVYRRRRVRRCGTSLRRWVLVPCCRNWQRRPS